MLDIQVVCSKIRLALLAALADLILNGLGVPRLQADDQHPELGGSGRSQITIEAEGASAPSQDVRLYTFIPGGGHVASGSRPPFLTTDHGSRIPTGDREFAFTGLHAPFS